MSEEILLERSVALAESLGKLAESTLKLFEEELRFSNAVHAILLAHMDQPEHLQDAGDTLRQIIDLAQGKNDSAELPH